ncbi:prenyltransferase [Streptomyces antibioticus]|nr:UbiA family prenyltransferase [Streptomyces antibioticus]KUN22301.1 prenyltransferase [Streptomyces antibioticus]
MPGGAVRTRRSARARVRPRARAWAELLRLPALFTVPGDVLAGAAAASARTNSRTLLAIGSSVCLYEAGMALNDWADRTEDAAERPHRPIPSGRIRPAEALTAACALTAAGLALAARAGRPALAVAAPLAATVWAYDLALKHTPAGPVAMAAARGLDLLLGAAATTGDIREAVPSAALLGTHTFAVTTVSRQETRDGSPLPPLAALAATALLTHLITSRLPAGRGTAATLGLPGTTASGPIDADLIPRTTPAPTDTALAAGRRPLGAPAGAAASRGGWGALRRLRVAPADRVPTRGAHAATQGWPATQATTQGWPATQATTAPGTATPADGLRTSATAALRTALSAAYAATVARPYFHAALNPSPPLTQRAVGSGIRATIPLQAALAARNGARTGALFVAALAPLGRKFARKVSVT